MQELRSQIEVKNESIKNLDEKVSHCVYTIPDFIKFTYYDGSYTLIR